MRQKPINPYTRLLMDIRAFCGELKYRPTKTMFFIKKADLRGSSYSLDDIYERTRAAEQLGYEVHVIAEDDGLRFNYVKKVRIPLGW